MPWRYWLWTAFPKQSAVLREVIHDRLLDSFEGILEEAQQLERTVFQKLAQEAGPHADPEDVAEAANDIGIERFEALRDARQALLNLLAVALYHRFEQQQIVFLNKALLPPWEEGKANARLLSLFRAELEKVGFSCEGSPHWHKLEELRLLANVVKHTEGPSFRELHTLRPTLFVTPALRDDPVAAFKKKFPNVYQPLNGEDVYVEPADLDLYLDALDGFWNGINEHLKRRRAEERSSGKEPQASGWV